jgi:hypothetical protein
MTDGTHSFVFYLPEEWLYKLHALRCIDATILIVLASISIKSYPYLINNGDFFAHVAVGVSAPGRVSCFQIVNTESFKLNKMRMS